MSRRVLMKAHLFAVGFPAINQCLGVEVLETVDEFSLIYIFTIIFVNNVYSEFNNVSYLVFHRKKNKIRNSKISASFFKCQKTKEDVSNSYFQKFTLKKRK